MLVGPDSYLSQDFIRFCSDRPTNLLFQAAQKKREQDKTGLIKNSEEAREESHQMKEESKDQVVSLEIMKLIVKCAIIGCS